MPSPSALRLLRSTLLASIHPFFLLTFICTGWLLRPGSALYAASASLQIEPQPVELRLGELFVQSMTDGELLLLELDVPEEGLYQFQDAGSDPAGATNLAVRSLAGDLLYEGPFNSQELRLTAGRYQLALTATNELQLALLVLGEIGELSADAAVPGLLFTGGIVDAQNVEGPLFGSLVAPQTPFAQEITLVLTPAAGESYLVSVQGADVNAVVSTDDTERLRFVSRGGLYQVIVQPDSPSTGFTLATQVSGPPPLLPVGESVTGLIPADASSAAWRFEPQRFYPALAIQLSSQDASLAINLEVVVEDEQGATLYKQRYVADAESGDGTVLEQITPGRYFLTLNRLDEESVDLPLELALTGTPAPPSVAIENGAEIIGDVTVTDTERPIQIYRFNVEQPGALVSVSRIDSAPNDYGLNVGRREGEASWRAALPAGAPTVQFVAPEAGAYFVTLLGSQGVFSYTLQVLESAPVPQINVNGLTWGEAGAGEASYFRLPLVDAQRWLTLLLAGSNRTELDISVRGYDETGKPVEVRVASTPQSSTEVLSLITDGPRAYEVRVENHGERNSTFFLLTRVEDPAAISQQWATAATVEGESTASAQLAVGEPDAVADAGAVTEVISASEPLTASAPLTETAPLTATDSVSTALTITGVWSPDAGSEVVALELAYSRAVVPSQVEIHLASPPFQIVSVEGFDAESERWILLWAGEDAAETAPGLFNPQLATVDFATDRIRVVVDTLHNPTTVAVDAVKLIGRP